ncbi:uncharacterized protein LOC130232519 [Danio aesculapii]|uniref:uncharacterized protein LOC130232519 n=1 Tax=Danio aesculapii TaxID=1142201 RepID=UPI0024C09E8F|nr:uncharacterized protein LOC130232519 [Danio aesculapii]
MDRHHNQSSDNLGREWSLVVLNLDPNVNEQELFESMTQFSQIHSMELSSNLVNNRRYAYVTFEHSGRAHQPHPVLPTSRYIERKTLLVSNLHPMVTEQQLIEKFGPLGSISTVQVCRNNSVAPVYAFVTFHHRRDAAQAQRALNFTDLLNKPLIIMWGSDRTTEILSDNDSSSQRQTEERKTSGETERDTAGETKRDTAGETERDTAGETERDTAGETQRDTAGETERDTPGETERDTAGETERDTAGETERDTAGETERDTAGETEERENSESSWGRRLADNMKSAVTAAVSSPAAWVGVGIGVCAAYAYFRSRS